MGLSRERGGFLTELYLFTHLDNAARVGMECGYVYNMDC